MILILLWISLITLITSQPVHSKVITINTTSGRNSTECCIDGEKCSCSSLSTALLNMTNNTVINITSESVTLEDNIKMGSGDLNNITITGNGATIMCNNSGGVYCEACDNVVIEGITWDRCGDPTSYTEGLRFHKIKNISIIKCTIQLSEVRALFLHELSGIALIEGSNFTSNAMYNVQQSGDYGALRIENTETFDGLNITISESNFNNNGYYGDNNTFLRAASGLIVAIDTGNLFALFIEKSNFLFNRMAVLIRANVLVFDIQLVRISVINNTDGYFGGGITLSSVNSTAELHLTVEYSMFSSNYGCSFCGNLKGSSAITLVNNSNITDTKPRRFLTRGFVDTVLSPLFLLFTVAGGSARMILNNLQIVNNAIAFFSNSGYEELGTAAIHLHTVGGDVKINIIKVNFMSNKNFGRIGGALSITPVYSNPSDKNFSLLIAECNFVNNTSAGHGAALSIDSSILHSYVEISNTQFENNSAGDSIAYFSPVSSLSLINIEIINSSFTNNFASCMSLSLCNLDLTGNITFMNNKADYGAALYLSSNTSVYITDNATVLFFQNLATQIGGAIYIDLRDYQIVPFLHFNSKTSRVLFGNNAAIVIGQSLYFDIPKYFEIYTNITDDRSFMNIPCQFSYYKQLPSNNTIPLVPCDSNDTLLNESPIVTSPHELRLYFPNNDGVNISSNSDYNSYYIKNNILGHDVIFAGSTVDHFGKPSKPSQFDVECSDCNNITVQRDHILVDNTTLINVNFTGDEIKSHSINVTLALTSTSSSLQKISTTLIVQLQPCIAHPGYEYSGIRETCVCYHHDAVECSDNYVEIKRGYWFGSVEGIPTISWCPKQYCGFVDRRKTRQGYFELPKTVNGQCNDHRLGRACGECGPGYTLAYDSTDCINVDHCSTGMTVLVVVLTCLYWIVVVVGVFSLMYFNFQISSGYMYGIIYYYSMVDILLDSNPYISYNASQFVSVLSSFAKLSPKFLGQLCFVKRLSGIDQLFINYSHAVAVALLTFLVVLAARYSRRITVLVSRCIIRVICLLLLLSYTSLASTSLQLLRPLKFTDVNEVYTYVSPHIEYFHGRHAIYGIVAVICELVVGIGLPLLLLLEPLLSRKINFIKIKPLLDQFQGCYKDKYRWFAAYYLICRQVIMLILVVSIIANRDYYSTLFYLQTACVVIAMIHMWVQPYRKESRNALDGFILLVMVLVVNINTFTAVEEVTTELSLVLVILPLLLICLTAVRKMILFYAKKRKSLPHRYSPVHANVYDEERNDVHNSVNMK